LVGCVVIASAAKQSSLRRRVYFNDPLCGTDDWIASLRSQ